MGFVETWLEYNENIKVDGFQWVGKNRQKKGGGGVGFLVSDIFDITDDNLLNSNDDDYERLWIKVRFGENMFTNLAVAYFPVEGTNTDLTDELYNQLLAEVIQIEESTEGNEHVLIMGDFNGRIGDRIPYGDPVCNVNGMKFLDFCNDVNMSIFNCSRKCQGKITWFRNNLSSTIDYIIGNDKTENCLNSMMVDEDRNLNLGSDHNMIILNMVFNNKFVKRNVRNDNDRIIWDLKPDYDFGKYQEGIKSTFNNWDANSFDNANGLWDSWKSKLIEVATETIGVKTVKGKGKPWWDEDIDQAIKDRKLSCQAHRKWTTSGSTNMDERDKLWHDYLDKKGRAKQLIKDRITQKRIDRCIDISKKGGRSSRDFWQELRGPRNVKDRINSLKLPNSNDVTHDRKIMNLTTRQYFQSLGKMNRSLHDTDNDIAVQNHIESLFSNSHSQCNTDQTDKFLTDVKFNLSDVQDALSKAKLNKSPGIDSITNELLKNGGDSLTTSIYNLFQRLVQLENIPHEWNKGIIIPIHKKGSKNDLNNYRGITLTSCVSKVFNSIIANSISEFIEDHNLLTEIQGGFRKQHRCEDHIFTLKSIAATRMAENKTTYLAFLDFSKAFDTVWRDGLLSLAWKLGIRGSMWKIISNLYRNVQSRVKFGDITTDFFDVDDGVKQGCVLSPILFCVYINELARLIKEESIGVSTCNVQTGCLFWADDVVLLANSEKELQRMLDIASDFSRSWKLDFNSDKSKVLVVGKRIDKDKLWKLGNRYISECDNYKYLGVYFSRNLSDHAHVNEVVKKGNRISGYIKSVINSHDSFNRVYYGDILWKTLALPSINYACSVWTCGSKSDIDQIENLQLQMARYILKAPRNTPSVALYGDLGWQTIRSMHDIQRIKYLARLSNLDMHRWPKLMLNALLNVNCNISQIRGKWLSTTREALRKCNMEYIIQCANTTDPHWLNTFKRIYRMECHIVWNKSVRDKSSLNDYALFKDNVHLERYLLDKTDFHGSSIKFKARSNTLPLNYRIRKWSNNKEGDCQLCNDGSIEDLRHFFFTCNSLNVIRSEEFVILENNLCKNGFMNVWIHFISSSLDTKLYFMLIGCPGTPKSKNKAIYEYDVYDIFDKSCKAYLKRAWSARCKMMNSVCI